MTPKRFEVATDRGVPCRTLIFPAKGWRHLPWEVRLQGPWYGAAFGDIAEFAPKLQAQIAAQGYAIITEGLPLSPIRAAA